MRRSRCEKRPRTVEDIVEACAKIREQADQGRERFERDEMVQLGLVHLVQVIGEAAGRVSPELRSAHPQVPWRQVICHAHRVVHDYFDLDLAVLWDVVSLDVPELEERIRAVLHDLE